MINKFLRIIGRLSLVLVIALAMYFFLYRPLQLNWGATDAEIARAMPGDEFVPNPTLNSTRAVTIAAAPAEIWPWLLQIGMGRAGWYSYDLLDNLARPSARQIHSAWQNLKPGDIVPISPNGKMGFHVNCMKEPQWILWGGKKQGMTWVWGLYALDADHTRLVSRVRMRYQWFKPIILGDLALDAGDFVMMRQCLLGIKARAEGKPVAALMHSSVEFFAWLIAFAGFIISAIRVVTKPIMWQWLIMTLTACVITIAIVMVKPPVWLDLVTIALIWALLWRVTRLAKKTQF